MGLTEKEKMIAGNQVFDVYDDELVAERAAARKQVEAFNALGESDPKKSQALIRQLFGHTGESVSVHATFRCDYGYNIYVDDDFFANYDCVMLDVAPIRIGKHCLLGPKVQLYLSTTRPIRNCAATGPRVSVSPLRWAMMFGSAVAPSSVRVSSWGITSLSGPEAWSPNRLGITWRLRAIQPGSLSRLPRRLKS